MSPDRLDILRLLLLSASIRLGAAIRCYECIPTEEDDCNRLPPSLVNCTYDAVENAVALLTRGVKAKLDEPPDNSQLRCLKLKGSVPVVKVPPSGPACSPSPAYVEYYRSPPPCQKISQRILECFMCDSDGCNVASAIVPASIFCLLSISAML